MPSYILKEHFMDTTAYPGYDNCVDINFGGMINDWKIQEKRLYTLNIFIASYKSTDEVVQ